MDMARGEIKSRNGEAEGHQWGGSPGKLMRLVLGHADLEISEGELHETVSKELEKWV